MDCVVLPEVRSARRNAYGTPLPFRQWGYSSPPPDIGERYSPNGTRHIQPVPLSEQRHETVHRAVGEQSDTSTGSRESGSLSRTSGSTRLNSSTTDATSHQDSDDSLKRTDRRFPTGHGIEGVLNALAQSDHDLASSERQNSPEITQSRATTPSKSPAAPPDHVPTYVNRSYPIKRDGISHLMRLDSGVLVEEAEGVVLKTTNNDHRNENNGRTLPEIEADEIRKIPRRLQKSETHPDRVRVHAAAFPPPIRQNHDPRPRQITPRPTYKPQTHHFIDRWSSLPRPEHRRASQEEYLGVRVGSDNSEGENTASITSSAAKRSLARLPEPPNPPFASQTNPDHSSSASSSAIHLAIERNQAASMSHECFTSGFPTGDPDNDDAIEDMIPAFMKAKIEDSARSLEENLPFNIRRKNNLMVTFSNEDNVKAITPRTSAHYD